MSNETACAAEQTNRKKEKHESKAKQEKQHKTKKQNEGSRGGCN